MKVFLASAFYRNEVIALLTYIILPFITFWVCILIAKNGVSICQRHFIYSQEEEGKLLNISI